MLRWCQSTLRTLDGHGCKYASNLLYSAPLRYTAIAKLANHTRSRLHVGSSVDHTLEAQPDANVCRSAHEHGRIEPGSAFETGPFAITSSPCALERRSEFGGETSLTNIPQMLQASHGLRAKARMSTIRSSHTLHPNHTHDHIATLQRLLSPSANSDEILPIADVFKSYEKASKQSMLHLLSGEQFTDLLSLCGTLSLASTDGLLGFGSSLGPRFQSSFTKPKLWSLILKIGEDKERLGFELSIKDRYWVVQACLAQAKATIGEISLPALTLARSQYQHFKSMTNDPDLHLPYLQGMMSLGNPSHIHDAVCHLCEILERVPDPDSRFAEFLWDIILFRASDLQSSSKERLSQTVFNRIAIYPTSSSFGTTPPFTLTSDLVSQGILRIPDLSAAFAATLFPCYSSHHHHHLEFLGHWAFHQARQALAPSLPLDIRWNNLILLAASMSSDSFPMKYRSSNTASPDSGNSLWRTALILESMDKKLSHAGPDLDHLCQVVQSIARPLWRMFSAANHEDQPETINLVYIAAFLRIAAKSCDEQLTGECFRLSKSLALWHFSQNDAQIANAQVVDTVAAYVAASVACEGRDWPGIYSSISCLAPETHWVADVTNVLLCYYASQNIDAAYDLYIHSIGTGIDVSSRSLHSLFTGLVANHRWVIVTSFLEHPATTPNQVELLFGECLRLFQVQRHQYADVALVEILARTACRLYKRQPPSASLKYPIRYFFSIMIWTQNTSNLVNLVMAIHRTAPEFFTAHLIRRLILQLIRRRELSNALKLFRVFDGIGKTFGSRPLNAIRRKLMLKFSQVGAHKLSGQLLRNNKQVASLAKRDALDHAVGCRMLLSPSLYPRHIQTVANADSHIPTIREAVSSLIRANRFYAARKLYAKSHSHLDSKTSTAIGNIILHGPMCDHEFRHGRLVRHILRTKDLLSRDCGFVSDRATVNIILKAFLRWKTMLDAKKVRHLFDKMIYGGYPIPEQFRRQHGVPFNSPPGSLEGLSLPLPSVYISFSKHVRPMYKMFIKAFYLRNDVSAAKTVVGILKDVEIQELREREKRSRARREGVIKKRMRELKKRAESVS